MHSSSAAAAAARSQTAPGDALHPHRTHCRAKYPMRKWSLMRGGCLGQFPRGGKRSRGIKLGMGHTFLGEEARASRNHLYLLWADQAGVEEGSPPCRPGQALGIQGPARGHQYGPGRNCARVRVCSWSAAGDAFLYSKSQGLIDPVVETSGRLSCPDQPRCHLVRGCRNLNVSLFKPET